MGILLSKNLKQTWNNLISDAAILLRLENKNKHFKNAINHFKKVEKAFPVSQKHLTGHSLGGFTASFVGSKFKGKIAKIVTFNKGNS